MGRLRRGRHQPIRHPFIEVAGDTYVMLDWFALEDGKLSRERITLVRLSAKELEVYDAYRATGDSVGNVMAWVQRRLRCERRRITRGCSR